MENNENYIDDFINSSISNIKDLARTSTIIGDPIISPTGNILIPVSKVSVGFVVGGGQYNSISKKLPYPMAGGSGGGVSVTPIGFIVEDDNNVKYIDIENKSSYQTMLNIINAIAKRFGGDDKNDK